MTTLRETAIPMVCRDCGDRPFINVSKMPVCSSSFRIIIEHRNTGLINVRNMEIYCGAIRQHRVVLSQPFFNTPARNTIGAIVNLADGSDVLR